MSSAEETKEPQVKEVSPDNHPSGLDDTSDNPPSGLVDVSPDDNSSIQAEAAIQDPKDTDTASGSDIEVIEEGHDIGCYSQIVQPSGAAEQDPNTGSDPDISTAPDIAVIERETEVVFYSSSAPPNLLNHDYVPPPYRIGADGLPIYPYKSISERLRMEDLNNPPPPPEEPKPKFEDSDSSYEHSPPDDPNIKCEFLDDEPL